VNVPAGVLTLTGPLAAPSGTVASIRRRPRTLNGARVPPTSTAVTSESALPSMVNDSPGDPENGVIAVILGAAATAAPGRMPANSLFLRMDVSRWRGYGAAGVLSLTSATPVVYQP
jgi:hypothetical protein